MRASELIGRQVRGSDGRPLGVVTDLRCVQDGPVRGTMAAFRVDALVVSHRYTGSLLGYDRRTQQGPWLIRAVIRLLHRNLLVVPWEAVLSYETDTVIVGLGTPQVSGPADRTTAV